MPALKYTMLQICIICCLLSMLGLEIVWHYPGWFSAPEHNNKLLTKLVRDVDADGTSTTQAATSFITLGSATSTEDSGFFGYILPIFQAATGLDVHVEPFGTGRALSIAARGDVDVLLVHDRVGEDKFVADGYGIDRRDVMHNDFVIIGPNSDPAGIRGFKDARRAFAAIAAKGALFASRGDDGGTYRMELRLWKLAGVEPQGQAWYPDLAQSIGATLNFAAALANAYTLTDRAAWASFRNRQNLEILTEGDPILFNPYGSILTNPAKWPQVKFTKAKTWHEWLTSKAGLAAITSAVWINGDELFLSPAQ